MKVAVVAAAALMLVGCSAPEPSPSADELPGTVTVFAAASLTDSFALVARAFEAENPDVSVVLNFGGSSGLATQIAEGAPVDVFAAASESAMEPVAGLIAEPIPFATNTLEIAVPADNPGDVTGLADFANPELAIAVCAVEVPCGEAAAAVFTAAGIRPAIDTYEQDVRAVLAKVMFGEVDAGLVYRTDVILTDDVVEGIELSEATDATTTYPIAVLHDAPHPTAAQAFVDFVLGPTGQNLLGEYGFGQP